MKFKNALKFLLASALLTGGAKVASAIPNSSITIYKNLPSLTDYADYYFNVGGFNMWIGSQKGISPYVSLNKDDIFGSVSFNYNDLNVTANQKEVGVSLNLGKTFKNLDAQLIGGLDIKRSNYSIDRNFDRNLILSNGFANETEIATSTIEQTANFFSLGSSKKLGGANKTNIFFNFGQYIQVSDIKDIINNIHRANTFDRDSTNQAGIPIVTETRANIENYTFLNSDVYNKRTVSLLEMGFEKYWGQLGSGFLSSRFAPIVSFDKSEARQTLYGSTRTIADGNTLVIVNTDSTNIGFNSSSTNPISDEMNVQDKDNNFGIRSRLSYDFPYSGKVGLTAEHIGPNQNKLILDGTYPLPIIEKYNNHGSVFNGSLTLSNSSKAFELGIVSPIGFDNTVNSNILLENLRDYNSRSKKHYENKRNLEGSVVYSEEARKLLSAGLDGEYFSQLGAYSPALILGTGVDFEKRDVYGYGGYSDKDFSVVGKVGTSGASILSTSKKIQNSPTFEIGYDKAKKATYFGGSLNF